MANNSGNSRLQTLDLYDRDDELAKIAAMLSVKTRRDIIRLINESPYSINQIAWRLNLPLSTASFHVKALENAGLVQCRTVAQKRGNEKIVTLGNYLFMLSLEKKCAESMIRDVQTVEIPIGGYTAFDVEPTCGIMCSDGVNVVTDTPAVFYSPRRYDAGIIWMRRGYLEYTIPILDYSGSRNGDTFYHDKKSITSLNFTFEICSETALYDHDCKSDITLSVNGTEICTFTSSGDYGERRGRLNPEWYTDSVTQYGLLQNFDIRFDGSYLNEKRVSDFGIDDLKLNSTDLVIFRIEVKKDARFVGGFNLFGKHFGDYPQDILMNITYQRKGYRIPPNTVH